MKTKNVMKALGIVGVMAGAMAVSGDTFAQTDQVGDVAVEEFDASQAINAIVNLPESDLGKVIIVAGSVAGVAAYIFTQKMWTLIIVAAALGSPFLLEGIEGLVGGTTEYIEGQE